MKKFLILLVLALLLSSMFVVAVDEEDEDEENECGIFNLGSCISQKLFEYTSKVINAPIQPLVSLVKKLLSEPVIISVFNYLWKIMAYVISIFYGLLFLYSGFYFITAGEDMVKRENAKQWLKNIVIMVVLIQASYYLYDLVLQVNSGLTSGVLSLIDTNFFLFTLDNLVNSALQFFFAIPYVLVLLITAILLIFRYAIVSIGIAIFPIGIFLYFIEPLKPYGRLILNFLGVNIFITFFSAIILLAFSKLIELSIFSSLKIMVMITAFTAVIFVIIYFIFFSLIKSAFRAGGNIGSAIAKYGKFLL
ncbi:hypothetical protein KY338_01715 [Candidatus Woesearchaeota archaeon]|nr:hypothetical protein [Candidatus Woesearchaeota archaeon]MBW3005629.1 hypothetical protein [Candidatus Woesearchaeota archaeon]